MLGINEMANLIVQTKINIPYKPALKTALERLSEPLVKTYSKRNHWENTWCK